jgi:protein required for attachment to host cells
MNRTCIVVADAKIARFFGIEPSDSPRSTVKLVEHHALESPDLEAVRRNGAGRVKTERVSNRQAGDVHPIEPRREQHRLELQRRFGHEIALRTARIVKDWSEAAVILVAEPRLLGLMRAPLRKALHARVDLKELAKDYTHFTPAELHDQLASSSIVPPRRTAPSTLARNAGAAGSRRRERAVDEMQ